MYYISEVFWDKGERLVNQDSVSLQEVTVKGKRAVLALVCDGIGGLWGGEQASGFVAERMTEWFYEEALPMIEKRRGRRRLLRAGIRALYVCNERMRVFAEEKQVRFGTTLTMVLIYGSRYLLWHSGDSRAYHIVMRRKGGKLLQLTKDHAGEGYALTRCIGSFGWKQPDVLSGRAEKGSVFLLCTDGFRHVLSEERLMETFLPIHLTSEEQIKMRLTETADYSMRAGEKDNISAIALKIE